MFNFKLGLNFWHSKNFSRFFTTSGFIHERLFSNQLTKIFIRSHHVSCKPFFFCHSSQGPNNIICFVSFLHQNRNFKGFDNAFDGFNHIANIFWHFFTLCLVFRKLLNAICCSTRRVKNDCNMCWRSEEHTSELQSRPHLVCRLLLEKKKKNKSKTKKITIINYYSILLLISP